MNDTLEGKVAELRQEAMREIATVAADREATKDRLAGLGEELTKKVRTANLIGLSRSELAQAARVSESLIGTMLRDESTPKRTRKAKDDGEVEESPTLGLAQ